MDIIAAEYKNILGAIAVIMTIWAHIPYLLKTIKGTNKPHIFTWIIWTLLTGIAFAAQVADNAGPGAWVTGATALICIAICLFAWTKGEKNITRSDWIMFVAGLAAIPLWLITDTPLWSIILIVGIDCCAFYPTFRKSWHKPFEEYAFLYCFNVPRHAISILALQNVSIITALYPAALATMNLLMYVMLRMRRKTLS